MTRYWVQLACLLLGVSVPAQADVVFDPLNFAKNSLTSIQTAVSNTNEAKMIAESIRQYNQLMKQYQALTSHSGFGDLLNGQVDQAARRWMPNDWRSTLELYQQGGLPGSLADRTKQYAQQFPTLPANKIVPKHPEHRNAITYDAQAKTTRVALGASEYVLSNVQERLQNIEAIAKKIDTTEDIKAAMDLNNRLATELAFINVDMMRLLSLQLNMQGLQSQQTINGITTMAEFNAR